METKDLLEAIGFQGEANDIEAVKTFISTTYVPRISAHEDDEITKKISGKVKGSIETAFNRGLKDLGIELDLSDLKELSLDKRIEKTFTDKLKGKIDEYKTLANTNNDDKVKSLNLELELSKNKLTEFEKSLLERDNIINETKTAYENQFKNLKLNTELSKIKAELPIVKDNKLALKGFDTEIADRFSFDFNEKNEIEIKTKDGQPIYNKNKTAVLSAKDVLLSIADENGLVIKSNPNPQPPKKIEGNTIDPLEDRRHPSMR